MAPCKGWKHVISTVADRRYRRTNLFHNLEALHSDQAESLIACSRAPEKLTCYRPVRALHSRCLPRRKRIRCEGRMTLEELRILRVVQGILVRNYVDTQKIEVEVIGSSVYIEGEFVMFEYRPGGKRGDRIEQELSAKRTLLHIEQQIRGMGEVTHLEMKLTNWERLGAQWVVRHEAVG
jgi:hypothetical protein